MVKLLDGASDEPWKRHTAGANTLIQVRGPSRYQTDFEQALLMSQAGPIVSGTLQKALVTILTAISQFTEAIINNGSCFLERKPWQDLFTYISRHDSTFTDCSKLVISLWATISPIPNLFADVQHTICASRNFESSIMEGLMCRVRKARLRLWEWRQRYESLLAARDDVLDKRYETLGVCLANATVLDRLIVALDPNTGAELEAEAQCLAHQIIELAGAACQVNARAALFMEFKLTAARAALATEYEWQIFIRSAQSERSDQPISKELFERWCSIKGRSIGDREKPF